MSKTAKGLVAFVLSQVGTPYVYGAKGQVVTDYLIDLWAQESPNVYDDTYIDKARKYIGRRAHDCSGLISRYTGILRGSSNFCETAIEQLPISQISEECIGWAVWKRGHIGVYIGNGLVVEARGIDYGTIKVKRTSNAWTHVLKLKDIDYSEEATVQKATKAEQLDCQKILNKKFGKSLKEDGEFKTISHKALIEAWQETMNKVYDLKPELVRDGDFGAVCKATSKRAVIRKGAKNDLVLLMQIALKVQGYYHGALDGEFGEITLKAVKEFQGNKGLTVDGECGQNTWSALLG